MATSNPFDPKAVVANSGKPKPAVNAAMALLQTFVRAPLDAAIAGLMRAPKLVFTDKEVEAWRRDMFLRARFGRGWWRRYSNASLPHQGKREIARRQRQIERDLISPLYRLDGSRAQ